MTTGASVLVNGVAANLLHLIVLPTEACNFRCVYCYEEFRTGRMPGDIEAGLRLLLGRRIPTLDRLDISWFGGEPLAASDIVLRTLDHVAALRGDSPGLCFRSDITTNGYLLSPALFERLVTRGVTRYQVSFDGPPGIHDRKRIQANGRGTFEAIWGNLIAMQATDHGFQVTVRLHVDRENAGECGAFLERMRADLRGDPRFRLFPRLLARWGGANDADLCVLGASEGDEVLARIRSEAGRLGVPLHDPGDHGAVCYASRGNSLVVRADGRINKCTIDLEGEANQIGRLGADGTVRIDTARALPWMRGLFTGDPEALRCPAAGIRAARLGGSVVEVTTVTGTG